MELDSWKTKHNIDAEIIFDGKPHRFSRTTKDSSYYVAFDNKATRTIIVHDWVTDEKFKFSEKKEGATEQDIKLSQAQIRETQKREEEAERKRHLLVSSASSQRINSLTGTTLSSYMKRKGFTHNYGCKSLEVSSNQVDLYVPSRDIDGKVWGFQKIYDSKIFQSGQRIKGTFHLLSTDDSSILGALTENKIYLCEGIATAASVFDATNNEARCVLSCFTASNIYTVCEAIIARFPEKSVIVCYDNDQYNDVNVGKKYAEKCLTLSKSVKICTPTFKDLSTKPTDWNDLHILEGLDVVKDQLVRGAKTIKIEVNEVIEAKPEETVQPEPEVIAAGCEEAAPPEAEGKVRGASISETMQKHIENNFHTQTSKTQFQFEKEALVEYFCSLFKVVYRVDNRSVYQFHSTHYMELEKDYILAFACKHLGKFSTIHKKEEFYSEVCHKTIMDAAWFSSSRLGKLNVSNGVLDLKTKTLSKHEGKQFFTYCLPYPYDSEAKATNFLNILNRVLPDDYDSQLLLQEYFGYAIRNEPIWIHKALVLTGTGRNGKSTLTNLLKSLLGQGNWTAMRFSQLNRPFDLQRLDGKAAAIFDEAPAVKHVADDVFKNLIAGGSELVEQKFKPSYVMQNKAKFVINCNELPATSDNSMAFYARFMIIKFNQVFLETMENFDPHIDDKLKAELSGILNYCLIAYEGVEHRGSFTKPTASIDALDDYRESSNPILSWFEDSFEVTGCEEDSVKLSLIYRNYLKFCEENGHRPTASNKLPNMIINLDRRVKYNPNKRPKFNGKRERILTGIKVNFLSDFGDTILN